MYNRDRLVIILISILLFRIPVSHIIGDNGCGYLSAPLEMFWCLTLLFGAGLTITLRGMMHDRVRRGQFSNAANVFSLAKRYTFVASILLLVICMVLYKPVSLGLFMDSGSRIGFLFVGPAVFLGLFINLNLGYLNGTDNMHAALIGEVIYAVSIGLCMILGSIIGVRIGTNISALLRNEEVTAMYGSMGAMAGICVGEAVTLAVLLAMTLMYQRSFRHLMRSETGRRTEHIADISGRFLFGIFSDGAQELFLHLPVLISLLLIRRFGISGEEAASPAVVGASVGAFYAKYIVLTGIPAVLATFPVQGSLKGIAASVNDSDNQRAADKIVRIFARVAYFAIPVVILMTVLSPVIVPTLYAGRLTTVIGLLTMGSSLILVYAVTYCFISVLVKLGYNREMLVVNAASLIIGCVLSVFLIRNKNMGFTGAVAGMLVCYLLSMLVCIAILLRNFHIHFRLLHTVILPLVIAGIIGVLIRLFVSALYAAAGGVLTLIICLIPAWFLYNIACMMAHIVSAPALNKKFLGPLLVRIGQNLGIY